MNRKLKNIKLAGAMMEVLLHLRDGELDGSLRSNTSTAEGGSYTLGEGAVAVGSETKASGNNSHAEGISTTASGHDAHAEGNATTASEWAAHAEGYNTVASNQTAHAEGYETTASGYASHAEGFNTTASGTYSHAEGQGSVASGANSHAEGKGTTASNDFAHAEGLNTTASGHDAHAEGSFTTASNNGAHAEGFSTVASGKYSHAEGNRAEASGDYSHAGGISTVAQRQFQTVIGRYNVADTGGSGPTTHGDFVFIIGKGGTESTRSNAMEVKWNGDTKISGTLTQSSDRRLKDHRSYLGAKSLEFIRKLKPAYFFKDQEPHVGLYAQDIEGEDPYRTILGEMNGFLTVNYTELIPHLITYCQHLEQRIEELERR